MGTDISIKRQVLCFLSFTNISGLLALISLSVWVGMSHNIMASLFSVTASFVFVVFISHIDVIVLTNFPMDIGCCSVMPLCIFWASGYKVAYCLLMFAADHAHWAGPIF